MGTGRRAFVRYPMVLDATLIAAGGREVRCAIKDFCMGGMLLHYVGEVVPAAPAVNEAVSVRAVVPLPDGSREIAFQARVARSSRDGAGIAFIDPEPDALRAMQQYALQFTASGPPPRRAEPGQLGRRFGDVIAGCNRIVQETMDSLLAQLDNRLERRLFELSRDAVDPALQRDLFNAADTVKKNQHRFYDVVRATFSAWLQSTQKKALREKRSDVRRLEELTLEEVSLIDDEALGIWLAVSDLTNKAEERYKEALALLEERLSVLFVTRIGHANNPYGPALFVESFQAGLGQYRFNEPVNAACYAVFKDILIGLLSDLYAKLNAILIEYGILPGLSYSMLHRAALPRHKPATLPPAPQPAAQDAPAFPRQYQNPKTSGASAASQDLYQLVQDLRALRQELARQRSDLPGRSQPTDNGDDSGDWYTTSDLLAAISELRAFPDKYQLDDERGSHVKARIAAALASLGAGASGKRLSPRDSNILEVTGDLLGAMQADPLVADSVKPWLKRLELPVIKVALLDTTLFFDHAHVVRQVVNNVAQLEYYRQESASQHNAISAAIEALLEKVAAEDSQDQEIFNRIQDKLDKLIKIQNQAYTDNVQELVKACQESPPLPDEAGAEDGQDVISTAETHKWLLHAARLRAGDNLLQLAPDRQPQRLRVGWVDEEKSLYVLVNLRGIREKVLKAADLAAQLRRGTLEPRSNATDPAMDRAQYVIMQDLYRQVLHESTHDGMTGLINRREFERMVKEAVSGAKRDGLRHVLIFADIDKFSAINTNCGYAGGDKLLQGVVSILRDGLPTGTCLARLGSDQFGILLEKCVLDDALAVAEHQIEAIAAHKLEWKGDVYSPTISMGLVPISARNGDVDELLRASEASCNIAKDMGGNRLQVYHAGHARIAHQTEVMKWVGKIDKMLAEDVLELRCQRIQPMAADLAEQPHYEILVGVKDEQGDLTSPAEFIKAAEWYRRMSAVDRYVITKAFSWLERNPGVVARIDGVSINLSGQSLNEEGFFEFILERLETLSLPREKICFEVTETVGVASLSDAALFIERIKEAGCRFSLDDFGSGMSSYAYLKHLPVDMVKIDGAFVQNMTAGSSDYVVVKSVTEIAHFMNKKVIAEFVENAEALALLREIGVDYVQGYLIDRPAPLDRLLSHLASAAEAGPPAAANS